MTSKFLDRMRRFSSKSPTEKGKNELHNIWLHSVAERMQLARLKEAEADNLSTDDIHPYPMSKGDEFNDNSVNHSPWNGAGLLILTAMAAIFGTLYVTSLAIILPNLELPPVIVDDLDPKPDPTIEPVVEPIPAKIIRMRFYTDEGKQFSENGEDPNDE